MHIIPAGLEPSGVRKRAGGTFPPRGGPLGSWVIQRLEQPFLQYVRTPDVRSFIFGALITAAFSYLINASALRRVKHLKLSDLS